MPPSITELSKYLSDPYKTVSWKSTSRGTQTDGPICRSCLAVVCYVLKLCSNSKEPDHITLINTIKHLNDLASSLMDSPATLRLDNVTQGRPQRLQMERDFTVILMHYFMQKVQKFFNVPNLLSERDSTSTSIPTRREILADFIHFLLQVLNSEEDLFQSLLSDPPEPEPESNLKLLQSIDGRSLWKELTFLLTYLGDIPFQLTTELDEEVNNNLLDDFVDIANDAGGFIYSRIFAFPSKSNLTFHPNSIRSILEKIEILNAKIVKHCMKFSMMFKCATPDSPFVDSLFIIDSLLEDLNHTITNGRFDRRFMDDVKDQIKTLHQVLMSTQSFLKDANTLRGTKVGELKEYLVKIRDLGYEAEYLINSFVVENVPVWYLNLRLPHVIQKFELIATRCNELKVLRFHKDSTREVPTSHTIESSMVDDIVVGFKKETIKILDALTGGSKNLQTVSIFGMPGLGKTTISKKLYNNRSVIDHFDVRAWCVISQTYNKRKGLIDLLMSLPSKPDKETTLNLDDEILAIKMQEDPTLFNTDDESLAIKMQATLNFLKMDDESLATKMQENPTLVDMDDESLGNKTHKTLTGRRYLIVVDDVWSSEVWGDLRRYFPDNENGSRIVFTTQIRDIVPSGSITQTLPFLSKDQSWELLQKKVFRLESCPLQLVDTGKQVAEKCRGLPLAVVVMAGILLNKEKDGNVWKEMEESLDLHMSNCMKILELSYKNLPDHLKLCFLYLAVFTEDTEVPVKKLLQLWISEGFIGKDKVNQESVAKSYLMELIDRSLVSIAKNKSTGGVKSCSVHDLLRDMCVIKAHEENFLKHVKDHRFSTYEKYHRLCVNSAALGYLRPFSLHCRSFLGHLSDPSSCLPQMKLLRVIELSQDDDMHTHREVTGIDHLVYLRYLVVHQMPKLTVDHLNNLEFLRIESTKHSVNVPLIVLRIRKLKHLHVRPRAEFEEVIDGDSAEKNNLETLSFVCIYGNNEYRILRASPHLRKLKCTCNPFLPDLLFLTKLESLKIEVSDLFRKRNNPTEIYLPSTITKLSLIGICLPWERMSIIGRLPKLQVLKLLMDAFDGEEWETTSEGGFQELRFLKLDRLKLKTWNASSEHFPKLRHLVLHKCENLKNIPNQLGDIMTLEMMEVHYCSYEASISAVQIEQEQLEYGNEELKVIITNSEWSKEDLVHKYNEEC